jgi:hypothetical protein
LACSGTQAAPRKKKFGVQIRETGRKSFTLDYMKDGDGGGNYGICCGA